jgi:TolB-like protein
MPSRTKVFILFASTKAFVSKNVTKELALASESDKHILPVFIEDAEIPAAMKYQLAGIQHLIHKKGDDNQTIDNILRTVSSLKIDSVEKKLITSSNTNTSLQTSASSKIPFAIAAITAIILAVVLTFFFSQGLKSDANKSPLIVKAYKSTTDLCIVTVHDSEVAENVFEGNRELRDGLDEKLSRFKDYKDEKGKAVSPDATTQEILSVAKKLNAEYVLQVSTNNEKERINAKLLNVNEGRNFWSKTLRQSDIVGNGDFIDEATGLIAAHIAGHDGAIHRDILAKALVKNEEDLTPIELLQLGKNVWEEQTEDVTVKGTKYLERCIELNPDISTAYAILSEV